MDTDPRMLRPVSPPTPKVQGEEKKIILKIVYVCKHCKKKKKRRKKK